MKKMLFVFNPNSGKAKIKNVLLNIIQILSEADYEITVYPTRAARDGYRYILGNQGKYDVIACSGGDGTVNEAVAAVLRYKGKKPPIAYIPSGTTNDFATSLNIPKDMISAAHNIAEGVPMKIDIGLVNRKRTFNYVAAFGAFTKVSYATPQSLKNILGHQAYVVEAVKSLSTLTPYRMKIETDGRQIVDSFIFGMVSNTDSVGGVKGITGNAVDLRDGLFEVVLVKEIKNPLELQQLITALVTQNLDKSDLICTFKTKKIKFVSEEPVKWTLDGEFGGQHKTVTFDVLKRAVEFIVKPKKKHDKITGITEHADTAGVIDAAEAVTEVNAASSDDNEY